MGALQNVFRTPGAQLYSETIDTKMQCRICFEEGGALVSPCHCRGTSAYIHRACLDRYIQHYPDRTCRVCRTVFHYYKSALEIASFVTLLVFLNALLLLSRERMAVKLALCVLIWAIVYGYAVMNLLTNSVLVALACLWGLFLPGGHYHAMLAVVVTMGVLSLLYTMCCFIPPQYILRLIVIGMVYVYMGLLTIAMLPSVEPITFTLYITCLFLMWNAVVHGNSPLRLLVD